MITDCGLSFLSTENNQLDAWELAWAPYDIKTYQAALDVLVPDDVVLDIGAGDLRLAKQMARIVKRVVAIEIRPEIVEMGSNDPETTLPTNLVVQLGDARLIPFPEDITTAVLLMRHCRHFQKYVEKLIAVGCQRLITNARWGMAVETIDLQAPRSSYQELDLGWYACCCGAVGFKAGSPEKCDETVVKIVHEVVNCPKCFDEIKQNHPEGGNHAGY